MVVIARTCALSCALLGLLVAGCCCDCDDLDGEPVYYHCSYCYIEDCKVCIDGECVSQCGDGQRCEDGVCYDPWECVEPCSEFDCEVCEQWTCVSSCSSDEFCHSASCYALGVNPCSEPCTEPEDHDCVSSCRTWEGCLDGDCVHADCVEPGHCNLCEDCDVVTGACMPANCGVGNVCLDGQCCRPACDGRACGDDGCGGSCGACPLRQLCDDGACRPCACIDSDQVPRCCQAMVLTGLDVAPELPNPNAYAGLLWAHGCSYADQISGASERFVLALLGLESGDLDGTFDLDQHQGFDSDRDAADDLDGEVYTRMAGGLEPALAALEVTQGAVATSAPGNLLLPFVEPATGLSFLVPLRQVELTATLSWDDVGPALSGGHASGYFLVADIVAALEAFVAERCDCLGLAGPLVLEPTLQAFPACAVDYDPQGCDPRHSVQSLCGTLAVYCEGAMSSLAAHLDVDLDADDANFEAMSALYDFAAVPAYLHEPDSDQEENP